MQLTENTTAYSHGIKLHVTVRDYIVSDWVVCNVLPCEEPLRPSVRGLEDFVMLQHNTSVTLMCRPSQIRNVSTMSGVDLKTQAFISEFLNNLLITRWMSRNLSF